MPVDVQVPGRRGVDAEPSRSAGDCATSLPIWACASRRTPEPRRRVRAPRVERDEDAADLGRVAAGEAGRQREDARANLLRERRILVEVAVVETSRRGGRAPSRPGSSARAGRRGSPCRRADPRRSGSRPIGACSGRCRRIRDRAGGRPTSVERQVLAPREVNALGERARQPVGAPGRAVQAQIVALEERVVPEEVDPDARVEAEVDERERREPRLVVRAEREEVVERPTGTFARSAAEMRAPSGRRIRNSLVK